MTPRALLTRYLVLCLLIGVATVPLASLEQSPGAWNWLGWLPLVLVLAILTWTLHRLRRWAGRPHTMRFVLAAAGLGILGLEAYGLAWLLSMRPVWEHTKYSCCVSDATTWPGLFNLSGFIVWFAAQGVVAAVLALAALGGISVAERLRQTRRSSVPDA